MGCGGGSSNSPAPTPNPGPVSGGGPVNPPIVVNVVADETVPGVDISVPGPASPPGPNATVLGVADLTGRASAFNTGGIIHRGTIMRVILFGPALSGDMQVIIGGPADIIVTSVTSITATDNTPGISFVAAVDPNAALGARSVSLKTSQNDITTFAGGMEVMP